MLQKIGYIFLLASLLFFTACDPNSSDEQATIGTLYWAQAEDPYPSITTENVAHVIPVFKEDSPRLRDRFQKLHVSSNTFRALPYLCRRGLDSFPVENITASFTTSMVCGVAIDKDHGKIYWTEYMEGRIGRANLDGSLPENITPSTGTVSGPAFIDLDVKAGKMYWADGDQDKLHRADLDGNNYEDITPLGMEMESVPSGLSLDLDNKKMYWTESGSNKIGRSNLDGTSPEYIIADGIIDPIGVALDISKGKMYWCNWDNGTLYRSNLDGSNSENITPTNIPIVWCFGITLDTIRGKVYFTDMTSKICRVNIDGTNGEDITPQESTAEIVEFFGLAIDPR